MNVIDIGARRELFVDEHLVDAFTGDARLKLHHPVPRETIAMPASPPGTHLRYMTVFRDRECCRMYYGACRRYDDEGRPMKGRETIRYGESRDGIDWTFPALGLFHEEGTKKNNIAWAPGGEGRWGTGGFSAFFDENPASPPEQRYKAITSARSSSDERGLAALASPDGRRWSLLASEPVMTGGPARGMYDSQNLAFWDAFRGEYRLYRREIFVEGPRDKHRDILTATSPDFIRWSPPRRLVYPGAPPEELYTNQVIPYFRAPHIFLGFPTRYVERPLSEAIRALPEWERREQVIRAGHLNAKGVMESSQRQGTALTDGLFMSSRDGLHFRRWGEAFIRPGLRPRDNWFYGDNYQNWGLVTTPAAILGAPEELSVYVSEGSRKESVKRFRRHTLRLDGFVSVNAGRRGGGLVTAPLLFSGRELTVNFSASAAGCLRVEIQDPVGWPLPGFELDNCVEALGDDLERRIAWQGGRAPGELAGKPVRLRFELVDADLYAFRFGEPAA